MFCKTSYLFLECAIVAQYPAWILNYLIMRILLILSRLVSDPCINSAIFFLFHKYLTRSHICFNSHNPSLLFSDVTIIFKWSHERFGETSPFISRSPYICFEKKPARSSNCFERSHISSYFIFISTSFYNVRLSKYFTF